MATLAHPYGPEVIHINTKDRIIEPRDSMPQLNIAVGDKRSQASYRFDCMEGLAHPMAIESHRYTLVPVCADSIDSTVFDQDYRVPANTSFNEHEMAFIDAIRGRPEVEWAIDNSFDGLYVKRFEDPSLTRTQFRFAVYLKDEHVTFWKLKYNGR